MTESPFGYESSAINTRRILAALGILAISVVIAVGLLHLVLHREVMPNHARVVDESGMIPPEPHLQAHPQADIAAERRQKDQLLSGYGWLDSSHSFARIPIQRAMQLSLDAQAPGEATQPAPATSSPKAHP